MIGSNLDIDRPINLFNMCNANDALMDYCIVIKAIVNSSLHTLECVCVCVKATD